jgi:glycosyltransferase involved in cell wall biosynthesis
MVNSKPKLAIVTTHPIQYNAPLFKLLAERNRVAIKVFYTWAQAREKVFDPGFGRLRAWDIPLLEGYSFTFVENKAKDPGSHHFWGIVNPGLVKEISDWSPDAVLVFGWCFYSHLRCLLYFKNRIPVFFRGDSTLLDENKGIRTGLRRIALKWVYRHINKAFYVGRNNRDYFLKHAVKEEQLVYAPHAIDNDRFKAPGIKEKASLLRAELGFQPGDLVVLFAGKLEQKKNPFFILQLAERLKDPQVKFLLVGNGVLENRLKTAAIHDNRIRFLDFQNQQAMPSVYRSADCFVLPSSGPGETWGLAANEAMASGLPVLLSAYAGGSIDLVDNNGLVFQKDELDKVVAYLLELKDNPAKRLLAEKASLEKSKLFSLQAVAEAIENTLC